MRSGCWHAWSRSHTLPFPLQAAARRRGGVARGQAGEQLARVGQQRLDQLEERLTGLDEWATATVQEVTDLNLKDQVEAMRKRLDLVDKRGVGGGGGAERDQA